MMVDKSSMVPRPRHPAIAGTVCRALRTWLLLGAVLAIGCAVPGCCRREPENPPASFSQQAITPGPKTPAPPPRYTDIGANIEPPTTVEARDQVQQYENERKREAQVLALLERAQQAMQDGSLDAALRDLQRIKLQYPDDPYVLMRVEYMLARVAHRQKNPKARKAAMDNLLRAMELVQKDPRFRQAHLEGRAAQDVVKQSVDRGGANYANP